MDLSPTRCLWCGAPLRQPAVGRRRRYCSPRCRLRALRMRREAAWSLPAGDGAPPGVAPEAAIAAAIGALRAAAVELARAGRYCPPLAGRADRVARAVVDALEREFPMEAAP